jgi:membrane carboxypeptidase/penicillin-binding protein PbpC
VGAWVGDPGFRPMNRLTGFRSAAALAQDVMLLLHPLERDGLLDVALPPPRGTRPVRLCALTGRLAGGSCDRVVAEWLRPAETPTEACASHLRLAVDRRTGRVAGRDTPLGQVEVRTYLDLPARYASWISGMGLRRPPSSASRSGAGPDHRPAGMPPTTPGGAERPVRISIVSPENGLHLLRDPETPPDHATLALKSVVDPPGRQVVWYVDGKPYRLVDYPYLTRWRLEPGEHVFQARLADASAASALARVLVQ